jgi:peptide/nickel transport system substrate-binding protein
LRIGYGTPPQSLDPHLECHIECRPYWIPLFETLYDVGPDATTVPLLAADVPQYSADGRQLSIPLRTGHTFHDGTALGAAAVKASLERGKSLRGSTAASTLHRSRPSTWSMASRPG